MKLLSGVIMVVCMMFINIYGQTYIYGDSSRRVSLPQIKEPFFVSQEIGDLWRSLDLPENKGKLVTSDENGNYVLAAPEIWDGASDLKENVIYLIEPDKMARFMVLEDGFAEWLIIRRERTAKGPNLTRADLGPERTPASLPPQAFWFADAEVRSDSLAGCVARANLNVIPCPVKLTAWLYVDSLKGYYHKKMIMPGKDKAGILLSIKGGMHSEEAGVKIFAPEVNVCNSSHYSTCSWYNKCTLPKN